MFIVGPLWLIALVWCLSTRTGRNLFAVASVVRRRSSASLSFAAMSFSAQSISAPLRHSSRSCRSSSRSNLT